MRNAIAARLNTTPEHIGGRLAWLLWRRWLWPVQIRYRQARCQHLELESIRVGIMREFMEGGRGEQRVICAECGLTIQNFGRPHA